MYQKEQCPHDGGLDDRACSAHHRAAALEVTPSNVRINLRDSNQNWLPENEMVSLLIEAIVNQG
eukprot:278609-Heterocapsa_arctica.AAC.1